MFGRFPGPGGFEGGCFGGGMHIFGLIIMVLFFIFVVCCIAMGARMMRRRGMMMHGMHGMHGGYGCCGGDPVEIARTRYAKGEISAEELEAIKKNLA